jgi:dephospho-CoA kinase
MLVVGITGNIGSGKTTLSALLKEKSVEVLDADLIAHEVQGNRSDVSQKIVDEFGTFVLQPNGEIDRKRLAEIVFNDPQRLDALDRIVHPHVIIRIDRRLREIEKEGAHPIVIVDAPLIIEAGMREMHDLIVVVVANDDLRLVRAASLGLTPEDVRMRDRNQMPQEEKTEYADYIIENNGSLEELEQKAADLWRFLQKKLQEKQ